MQNDLISRQDTIKALREYAEQKHVVGQTELANGILKAVNFLGKEENVPTAYDVENVVEQLSNAKLGGRCDAGVVAKEIVHNGGKE